MIYLATPYTHADKEIMQLRYEVAREVAANMMRAGLPVYSPIVHGHDIASHHELPTDWEFWRSHCLAMLSKADQMMVVTIPGWETSTGVHAERAYCRANGIGVSFISAESARSMNRGINL